MTTFTRWFAFELEHWLDNPWLDHKQNPNLLQVGGVDRAIIYKLICAIKYIQDVHTNSCAIVRNHCSCAHAHSSYRVITARSTSMSASGVEFPNHKPARIQSQ